MTTKQIHYISYLLADNDIIMKTLIADTGKELDDISSSEAYKLIGLSIRLHNDNVGPGSILLASITGYLANRAVVIRTDELLGLEINHNGKVIIKLSELLDCEWLTKSNRYEEVTTFYDYYDDDNDEYAFLGLDC